MSESEFNFTNPPIVEAVLDIECDLPPRQEIATLEEAARECFCDRYPVVNKQIMQKLQIKQKSGEQPEHSFQHGLQAFHFLQEDKKQLVQVRMQGFSFNRLSPYTRLDDYLPEIERCWKLYVRLASPVQVRTIRLRNINLIPLPLDDQSQIALDKYFTTVPRLPNRRDLKYGKMLIQYTAEESATGHQVITAIASQQPKENKLPIIFDNCVVSSEKGEIGDWPWIISQINSLRVLKDQNFRATLTEECMNLFR